MNVSAIIVTRGDVDLDDVVCSFSPEWEVILWDNGAKNVTRWTTSESCEDFPCEDLSVYGRYAAINYASHDLIYVQDDDVLHTPESSREIIRAWINASPSITVSLRDTNVNVPYNGVVCNMPERFRHGFYQEHALVGFGACFHRDLPRKAFRRWWEATPHDISREEYQRTCDIVFTALTPRVLVDVPYQGLPWESTPKRMWMQPTHQAERQRMLELVLKVRDA